MLELPLVPMEAKPAETLPLGAGWQYEPKWDGFRCIAAIRGGSVSLQSKAGKPLGRYFPEVVAALGDLPDAVLDGELLIPVGPTLSFGALQMRLHPAESRIRRLAAETPARLMLFDLLEHRGTAIAAQPLAARRAELEAFHAEHRRRDLRLSPLSLDRAVAEQWLGGTGTALDGVIAKRRDEPYRPGERAMVKVKRLRTADCVVGGFRYASAKREVGSLLLGLYDDAGLLHHVGFTAAVPDRAGLTRQLEALVAEPGFTGDAPGGPSRWQTERSTAWQPLRPTLVAEVRYDHVTNRRFRHGTAFLRWRPDKAPAQCTMDQLGGEARPSIVAAAIDDINEK
ncbi:MULTISPECIES: ATP-dependent DNA ligase [unclassified Sphingomonas]|uniref:ATP-dependent DNA ligase n=1 Tax=unclassified Sphingomonas TaxID=196159 RepID=UPI00226B5480|nr:MULTISPECIES: ATP-dependent DNA ligase [unclassified Sphingomonas]